MYDGLNYFIVRFSSTGTITGQRFLGLQASTSLDSATGNLNITVPGSFPAHGNIIATFVDYINAPTPV